MVLMAAIILMWLISLEIIRSKKMGVFLPFFMISLSYCINIALNFITLMTKELGLYLSHF